ncbi:hypothetical protein D9Q98_008111 [Chlorella vulgaris]|uniref:Autophagy-related protein 9 n=1 Tax=Chlorella vulgaris TaxID=3077 RepID=A0A9D4TG02_CHLVU|nr:hypothetical protein D9Q98_008111 [Chlorella vulgaris]
MDAHYEPLPSMPEDNGHSAGIDAEGGEGAPPDALLGSEQWQWEGIPNLDQFFTRIYRYWEEKGFVVMLTSRVLNLLALAFSVVMSALLLLYVDWGALQAECLRRDTCDIWEAAIRKHPLEGGLTLWTGLAVAYLLLFSAYWLAALAHLVYEVRELAEVKHFCNHKLGISERQMGTVTWPEVAHRLVQVQRRHRLCMARDLSEHDIVARVMRKENYLVGMLNKGVLALSVPIPGLRRHLLLTKTLEWNLYWSVLDAMFDDHFRIKPAFLRNEPALRKRLRVMAVCNLVVSPFLLVFLLIYFFMKNAEKFYHHPSSVGARRWSPLATWRLRELNELPHFIRHRLNASHKAAEEYIQQFPNPVLSHAARFVAFVAGSVAALLLVMTLLDERLLERDLLGRQLVWWVAVVGVVLALSRAFVIESETAFDPEVALMEVVLHTHYLPRHWRGRAHTREVQQEFEALFQYKALLFLEELSSILLTPLLLWFSLPQCAGTVLSFVEQNTTYVEGVGDVCSLAAFDFQRHGNTKYGAPADAPKGHRSRQGKMEKSFLSFAATYPAWEPGAAGQQLLQQLNAACPSPSPAALLTGPASLAWSVLPVSPRAAALQQQQQAQAQQLLRWQPGAARLQQHALAAALASRGMASGFRGAERVGSSIFGSADLTTVDTKAPSAAGAAGEAAGELSAANLSTSLGLAGDAAPDDRLRVSQLLLQSLYRRRSHAPEQLPLGLQGGGINGGNSGGGLRTALSQQHVPLPAPIAMHQEQQQQQQQSQQQQQPAGSTDTQQQRHSSGTSLGGGSYPPSPPFQQPRTQHSQHTQHLQQQQHGPVVSPGRQAWLGRSPSGPDRVSELSFLSRETSAVSRENSSSGTAAHTQPDGTTQARPVPAVAPSWQPPSAAHSPEAWPAGGDAWLLQQQLLRGSGMHSSSGGGDGSASPPEFF